MRIGLVLPMATGDVDRVLAFAGRAEELGFDGVFAFDHLFPPGAPPDRPSLEAYTTLASVAAVTSRVVVGTLVTRASLRPAGLLAKQAASLDALSGGRFVLGIGTGDALSRAEHVAFGLPYLPPAVRRDHLVETIRAAKALWSGGSWGGGEHVSAVRGPLLPRPRTPGGPTVWVGGTSEGAVRVAAAEADGWNGWGLPVQGFAERARLLASASDGRGPEPTWGGAVVVGESAAETRAILADRSERGLVQDWAGSTDEARAWLAELRRAGATWAIMLVGGPPDRVDLVAEQVLASKGEA